MRGSGTVGRVRGEALSFGSFPVRGRNGQSMESAEMFTNSNDFRVKKTIGSSWNVDEDDVVKTKTALKKTGDYKAPEWGVTGYPDQDMFDGLKSFQKREGLQVDGVMKPDGPTEKRLAQKTKPTRAAETATASTMARKSAPANAGAASPQPKNRETGYGGLPDWSGIKMTPGPSLPPEDTSEIRQELPGGRNRGLEKPQKRPGEVQVAMMPTTVPGLGNVGIVGARRNPAELGEGNGGGGALALGAAAAKLLLDQQRKNKEGGSKPPKDEDRSNDRSNRVAIDPPPPTPGFEPPDDPRPKREEFPAENKIGPTTEVFPNPGEREAVLETFPIEDSLGQWIILENSRGDDDTQGKNDILIKLYGEMFKRWGVKAEHTHGGHTHPDKDYLKERYIRPVAGIGAARPDGTFELIGTGDKERIEFNTVDNLKDGHTPDARERKALNKIRRLYQEHNEKSDIQHYPKRKGTALDDWENAMHPLVEEYFEARFGKKPPKS